MAIVRWDPFREAATLQNHLGSFLSGFGREGEDPLAAASFVPPVDIYEDEQKVVLKVEAPGMKEEDLDVELENHTLTVRGERKFENEEKEENFHRFERHYGSFYRSFTIPNTVNPESVKADYDAGVLRIEMEKRAEAKPKQIKVQAKAHGGKVQAKAA